MNKAVCLPAVSALLAIGCAAPSPENLAGRDTLSICSSYGVFKNGMVYGHMLPPMRTELVSRGAVTLDEWDLVEKGAIRIGMSQCALYASWGSPSRQNRSVSGSAERIQHVYNAGYRYIKATYVYTVNGRVTSWQD